MLISTQQGGHTDDPHRRHFPPSAAVRFAPSTAMSSDATTTPDKRRVEYLYDGQMPVIEQGFSGNVL